MNIFGYTIDVYKTDTEEGIHKERIKNFKLNATKGLVDARLQLLLNQDRLDRALLDEDNEAEIEKLTEDVTFQENSIKNYQAQLSVLNKEDAELRREKVVVTFYKDNPPVVGDTIKVGKLVAEFKDKQ